jgi:hypothetical protein
MPAAAVNLMDAPPAPPRSTNPFAEDAAPVQTGGASLIDFADAVMPVAPPPVRRPTRAAPPPPPPSRGDCCVCLERPIETALLECGHALACMQCAAVLSAAGAGCPCCRQPITRIARIYI